MKGIFICLLFICQASYANTLYSRASECTIDLDADGKEFKTSIYYSRSKDEQEQLNAVRKNFLFLLKNN